MGKESKTLDNFDGFENPSEPVTFFGESDIPSVEGDEILDVVINDDIDTEETSEKEKNKNPKSKTKEEEEVVFESFEKKENPFEEEEEEEEEGQETGDKKKPVANQIKPSVATLTFLKEKGFVEAELEDGKEYSDDEIENLVEDAWEDSIDKALEETLGNLPPQVKELVKFANKGGDVNELLASMVIVATNPINKNSDISEESVQEASVRADLKEQGYDEEYIQTHIEVLKDTNKLEAIGKKAFEKIVAKQEKETADKVKEIEEANKTKKQKAREFKTDLSTFVGETKEVKGLSLSKEDITALPSYISEPKVELADGRIVTELQADIYKAMGNKESLVALAKVVKSGFDFSSIKKKAITEETKGNRRELANKKPDVVTTATSSGTVKAKRQRDLVDLLGD